ncbi:nucleoside kinase [Haloimpatiens sp. FM7315]|uniref:nucleoside kinase n=1 Tax=Haloimpatiens sp. FM7315 TaxID=3298609 RepID=UPI00397785F8
MDRFEVSFENKKYYVDKKTTFYDFITKYNISKKYPIVLGKLNDELFELTCEINKDGEIDFLDTSFEIGMNAYIRTLQFVLIKAVYDIFKEAKITIEHSLGNGIFGEIHKKKPLTEEEIIRIKEEMKLIIDKDIPIKKIEIQKKDAISIFEQYGMKDKLRLLNHVDREELKVYKLQERYDYFYGPMAYSTGVLKFFDLMYYRPGFILRVPSVEKPNIIKPYIENKKLARIFYETEKWGEILNIGDVGALNDKAINGDIVNIVRVAEALHEKKIANIADKIFEKESVKIVLIAGPSSSGKTTFTNRLGIQLRVNGLMPIPISLDDYFVNRENTPKDEKGNYDFESIYALDLELFNKNLGDLLKGEEVSIPSFNFKSGEREWKGKRVKIPQNGIILVEGIHGLNEQLTKSIAKENKFKIYISALTQLNLDNHNRIATTDVRKIRRIVRDYLSRGYGAEETLKMWPSIKKGEKKNIFVFQEEADAMFNSTLVYELCILKKHAIPLLSKIDSNSPVYYEALRLMSFLRFFKDLDETLVLSNSILREFIGGSCFYEY